MFKEPICTVAILMLQKQKLRIFQLTFSPSTAWMKPKTKSFPIVFKAIKSNQVLETILKTCKRQEIIDLPQNCQMNEVSSKNVEHFVHHSTHTL